MRIGDRVKFKDHCFVGPYAMYFLAYKGHEFEVTGFLVDPEDGVIYDHVGLRCLTGTVEVKGHVHDWDLERV